MQKYFSGLVAGLAALVLLMAVPLWIGVAIGMVVRGFRLGAGW